MYQQPYSSTWNPAAQAYGRYWVDAPGEKRKQQYVPLGVHRTRTLAERKLREHIDKVGVNSAEAFIASTTPIITFEAQAKIWLADQALRRRTDDLKQATIDNWRFALDKWILPLVGDRALSEVNNAALREVIAKMLEAGLKPKSITNYTLPLKMVVASAVNEQTGDQLYPVKWNHDWVRMPVVKPDRQRRPAYLRTEVERILQAAAKGKARRRFFVMFALMAATGLRIGEVLALKDTSFSQVGQPADHKPDSMVFDVEHSIYKGRLDQCLIFDVYRSIYRGEEQDPKGRKRLMELPEPLAAVVREFIKGKTGYIFGTRNGKPMSQRNALRMLETLGGTKGQHAFRRFRTNAFAAVNVPEMLREIWFGHSPNSVMARSYDQLATNLEERRKWADLAGLGFTLPELCEVVRKINRTVKKVAA